jgi:hypothetical protein
MILGLVFDRTSAIAKNQQQSLDFTEGCMQAIEAKTNEACAEISLLMGRVGKLENSDQANL